MWEKVRSNCQNIQLMRGFRYIILIFLWTSLVYASPVYAQDVVNQEFEATLKRMLDRSIPFIDVQEAFEQKDSFVFLDTRESEEFTTSHIPGAVYAGYNEFSLENLSGLLKNSRIIVYCSVGYRSEKIGKLLRQAGYEEVYNLYGSIFEWVNRGYPVINDEGLTDRIHTYNKKWSKWVDNPLIIKTW